MRPPRIIENDSSEPEKQAPGSTGTVSLPALIRPGPICSPVGYGPVPTGRCPGSRCRLRDHFHALGQLAGDQRRQPDAGIEVTGRPPAPARPGRPSPHHCRPSAAPPALVPQARTPCAARSCCPPPVPRGGPPPAARGSPADAPHPDRSRPAPPAPAPQRPSLLSRHRGQRVEAAGRPGRTPGCRAGHPRWPYQREAGTDCVLQHIRDPVEGPHLPWAGEAGATAPEPSCPAPPARSRPAGVPRPIGSTPAPRPDTAARTPCPPRHTSPAPTRSGPPPAAPAGPAPSPRS
jgi:hypothetical protein